MQFLRAMRFVAIVALLAACAGDVPDGEHEETADFEVDPEG